MGRETLDSQKRITINNQMTSDGKASRITFNDTKKFTIIHSKATLTVQGFSKKGIPKLFQTRMMEKIVFISRTQSLCCNLICSRVCTFISDPEFIIYKPNKPCIDKKIETSSILLCVKTKRAKSLKLRVEIFLHLLPREFDPKPFVQNHNQTKCAYHFQSKSTVYSVTINY